MGTLLEPIVKKPIVQRMGHVMPCVIWLGGPFCMTCHVCRDDKPFVSRL